MKITKRERDLSVSPFTKEIEPLATALCGLCKALGFEMHLIVADHDSISTTYLGDSKFITPLERKTPDNPYGVTQNSSQGIEWKTELKDK